MIYRITAESGCFSLRDEATGEYKWNSNGGYLRGISRAGFNQGFGDLKITWIEHPRVRFYFTEEGWQVYGRRVSAEARRHGVTVRVRSEKNPNRSRVVYQDKYQVVLLPHGPEKADL